MFARDGKPELVFRVRALNRTAGIPRVEDVVANQIQSLGHPDGHARVDVDDVAAGHVGSGSSCLRPDAKLPANRRHDLL